MCGIAGYVGLAGDQGVWQKSLHEAVGALRRRGPDGTGFHFSEKAGLGHARLAIIDLDGGRQPLFNEDQSLSLIVNGEFYNYREIRQDLEAKGHGFRTGSDSEVFVHLYEDGPMETALNRLNGMWALALWDESRQRLVLSRDRVGKKPLYYSQVQGGLVFASEIKALLAFPGIGLETDQTALTLYLKYGCVPAPYSIYRSIRKLPPASFAVYENNNLSIRTYWRPPLGADDHLTFEDWAARLDELLEDAVRMRLISDVPLGVFLSGGLDSSLIAALMVGREQGLTKSFSIGFTDRAYDESGYARQAAKALGTDHQLDLVAMNDPALLPRLASYFDEPFADASLLPTWYLCRATRTKVTVALSGDGGDELFGGYRRYLAGKYVDRYLGLPRALRQGMIEPILDRLPAPGGYYGRSFSKKAKLFVASARRMELDFLALAPTTWENSELEALFPGLDLPGIPEDPVRGAAVGLKGPRAARMMRLDLETYLPDDILVKVDRMSMFHALEVQCPFLDHRIVELACRMPLDQKIRGTRSKAVLKQVARNYLPRNIVERHKQGFMAPLDVWFRRELKDYVFDLLSASAMPWSKAHALKVFDEHQMGRRDQAQKLWTLVVLGEWQKGRPDSGS